MLAVAPQRQRMTQTPTLDIRPERDPLATIAASAAPVVLEGRYRLLMRALWELRHSRRTRWGLGVGSAAIMILLAYAGNQRGWMDRQRPTYNLLNLVGSGLLEWIAIADGRIGFIFLESAWALLSIPPLLSRPAKPAT